MSTRNRAIRTGDVSGRHPDTDAALGATQKVCPPPSLLIIGQLPAAGSVTNRGRQQVPSAIVEAVSATHAEDDQRPSSIQFCCFGRRAGHTGNKAGKTGHNLSPDFAKAPLPRYRTQPSAAAAIILRVQLHLAIGMAHACEYESTGL
jgi:hypothetical protein